MLRLVYFLLLLLCLTGCRQQPADRSDTQYVVDTLITVVSPRGQENDPDLDWILTTKAVIESEHRAYGDEVSLSVAFFVHNLIAEQTADRYYLGKDRSISLKGMAPTLLRLLATYGAMHQSAYHASSDFRFLPLCREMERLADSYRTQQKGASLLARQTDRIMEKQICPMPRSVFMLGCVYTPMEFGRSMCRDNEYLSLSSFTHHPFGQRFVLEVDQNRYRDTFLNLPIDTLSRVVVSALRQGHTVCWEGDLSGLNNGVCTMGKEVTQAMRQEAFDRFETVLNKALLLVGTAHDGNGKFFFVGKDLPADSLVYLSADYFKLKTVAVTLASASVPDSLFHLSDNTADQFVVPDSI